MKNQFVGLHLDFIGFGASVLCAVHCAALPLLLSHAALAGLQFLENPWIEYAIILLSLIIASKALIHGYHKHHRKLLPLILAVIGYILIGWGHVSEIEWGEILLTSCGGLAIAIAHFVNWKHLKQSSMASPQ